MDNLDHVFYESNGYNTHLIETQLKEEAFNTSQSEDAVEGFFTYQDLITVFTSY